MLAGTGTRRSTIGTAAAGGDPGTETMLHLVALGHSAAFPSDRSAAIAEMPNPALANEWMRAAIVRRLQKKANLPSCQWNAVGNAPRTVVDQFAQKVASAVSLGKA